MSTSRDLYGIPKNPESGTLSYIRVRNSPGTGSNGGSYSKVFSQVEEKLGDAITYVSDPVFGDYFIANKAGIYAISATLQSSTTDVLAITRNIAGTVQIGTEPNGSRLSATYVQATTQEGAVSWTGYLKAQDFVRCTQSGQSSGTAGTNYFTITLLSLI